MKCLKKVLLYMLASTMIFCSLPSAVFAEESLAAGEVRAINEDAVGSVHIRVLFDAGYVTRYPSASSRITAYLNVLRQKYLQEFNIVIDYGIPLSYMSYSDLYCDGYSASCTHASSDSACENSEVYASGTVSLSSLHHKNVKNNMYRLTFPDLNSEVTMLFWGQDNSCIWAENASGTLQHYYDPYAGLTNSLRGLMMIMSFSGSEYEQLTVVHEFGHLFSAPDHYNASVTARDLAIQGNGSGFSNLCIYGLNKNHPSVLQNLIICDGCKEVIRFYAARFQH